MVWLDDAQEWTGLGLNEMWRKPEDRVDRTEYIVGFTIQEAMFGRLEKRKAPSSLNRLSLASRRVASRHYLKTFFC